jgi:hypothetical protein
MWMLTKRLDLTGDCFVNLQQRDILRGLRQTGSTAWSALRFYNAGLSQFTEQTPDYNCIGINRLCQHLRSQTLPGMQRQNAQHMNRKRKPTICSHDISLAIVTGTITIKSGSAQNVIF